MEEVHPIAAGAVDVVKVLLLPDMPGGEFRRDLVDGPGPEAPAKREQADLIGSNAVLFARLFPIGPWRISGRTGLPVTIVLCGAPSFSTASGIDAKT